MEKDMSFRFYQYCQHMHSFVPDLLPEEAMYMNPQQVFYLLRKRFGESAVTAFQYSELIPSPIGMERDSEWLKSTNMVGVNVRTIGSFWNLVKYAFTLPNHQNAIHILPIWECGVVASLYGMASWNINGEFFSAELQAAFPHLDNVEKQLKVVVNILHLMGKTVGIDVIPHTDRYSEMALANPAYFEWLQRNDMVIVKHNNSLHKEVEKKILDFIVSHGSATYNLDFVGDDLNNVFFSSKFPEHERLRILFGEKENLGVRNHRRNQLIQYLYEAGFETVPATMGPPYRGLKVDTSDSAKVIDQDGRVWRDFVITTPQKFSRVFGPLARYKVYETKNDNRDWEIDFSTPRHEVFEYVAQKYGEVARLYNFDFMRGDMSHVQMRADGVPNITDNYYDLLKYIKLNVQKEKPYFGYFAESFLAPDGEMAYGSEIEHLEQSCADSTLGDLQSTVVGSGEFLKYFSLYDNILKNKNVTPCFTMMTADKDDPRFDLFYVNGNELRYFLGVFLLNMPSYMGLGFECRDTHLSPAPNEHYTKLYVFQIAEGEKATSGDYQWGKNHALFNRIEKIRLFAEKTLPKIRGQKIIWHKEISTQNKLIIWQYEHSNLRFIANLDCNQAVPLDFLKKEDNVIFSSLGKNNGSLEKGECIVAEIV
jgi:hypothetical protein